jgi:tRNA(His) guanylyltransferase
VLRLDGRAFHTYLRGCAARTTKFMADMDAVAEALCKEITGTVFAYTQSDEISLLSPTSPASAPSPGSVASPPRS